MYREGRDRRYTVPNTVSTRYNTRNCPASEPIIHPCSYHTRPAVPAQMETPSAPLPSPDSTPIVSPCMALGLVQP
ncbi:predicted protein [Plenodomus lingam JN3]|uniref:Predicted protein n=1 Tax=Leptosphaeria maculans (strain JN3 / isolate v23.1.3 / race Av1-4-5-6-7-8) TaxID=985895 RepID=E4ZYB9_LEPMJ|nr:predicted protein [Plenodomus lingam JN3]CBX96364.1 predicted protein [Plenodomus lingam JN3]